MQAELSLRKNIQIIFIITMLLMVMGVSYTFYKSWTDYSAYVTDSLIRDAGIASSEVEAKLAEAAKVLDVAKMRMEETIAKEQLTPRLAHELLNKSVEDLQRIDRLDATGLLFVIDAKGRLFAESDRFPSQDIDFSDRYYFQAFQGKEMPHLVVSNLVKARTTGEFVFHLATPLRDARGALVGVLVQQILANRVAGILDRNLGLNGAEIRLHTHDGRLMFVYPFNLIEQLPAQPKSAQSEVGTFNDWGRLEQARRDAPRQYVGYVHSSGFDFIGGASLLALDVLRQYFRSNLLLMLLSLTTAVIILGLFWHLLRVAKRLETRSRESLYDPLTGLGNRRLMDEAFPRLWREAMRVQHPICGLFIDVDHFKKFNDEFGHEAGDQVLKAVGQVLREHARRPLDLCCRWGGEEFAIIFPNASEKSVAEIAQSILRNVQSAQVVCNGVQLPCVTVSIGLACAHVTPENMTDDLVDMADKAMLQAKSNGRNQCQIYRG